MPAPWPSRLKAAHFLVYSAGQGNRGCGCAPRSVVVSLSGSPVEFLLGGWALAPPGLSLLLSGSVTELPQAGNWAFPVLGLLFESRLQENGFGVGECNVLLWQDMKPPSRRRCGNSRSLKRLKLNLLRF